MESKSLSLIHLVRPPRVKVARPPLLLLLHGYGGNELQLFEPTLHFDARLLIISARAPIPYGGGEPESYIWFKLIQTPEGETADLQEGLHSLMLIFKFISEAVVAYSADPQRVYLLGFSQGAILSGSIALVRPDMVAAAVVVSGLIPPEVLSFNAAPEHLANLPLLIAHGIADARVPVEQARASRDMLAALPVKLTYREYPMEHEISVGCLADIAIWLSARLDEGKRWHG